MKWDDICKILLEHYLAHCMLFKKKKKNLVKEFLHSCPIPLLCLSCSYFFKKKRCIENTAKETGFSTESIVRLYTFATIFFSAAPRCLSRSYHIITWHWHNLQIYVRNILSYCMWSRRIPSFTQPRLKRLSNHRCPCTSQLSKFFKNYTFYPKYSIQNHTLYLNFPDPRTH